MLFERRLLDGLADGSITVALRRWHRQQVIAGCRYRSPDGMVEVTRVDVVDTIDDSIARAAGFASAVDALADLPAGDAPITVVYLHRVDEPDPRDVLSRDTHIDDLDALRRKVAPYRAHLDLIAANPGVRAPDLAAQLGLETLTFKRQVRRLKELGLTHSLPVGYRLSPRGDAFLGLDAIAAMAELYNEGRVDELVDTFFAADARLLHATGGIDLSGREAIRGQFRHALERWPDRTNEIIRTDADGDTVVVEKRWRATDPDSGEPLEIDHRYVYRFEGGRIVEQREHE